MAVDDSSRSPHLWNSNTPSHGVGLSIRSHPVRQCQGGPSKESWSDEGLSRQHEATSRRSQSPSSGDGGREAEIRGNNSMSDKRFASKVSSPHLDGLVHEHHPCPDSEGESEDDGQQVMIDDGLQTGTSSTSRQLKIGLVRRTGEADRVGER